MLKISKMLAMTGMALLTLTSYGYSADATKPGMMIQPKEGAKSDQPVDMKKLSEALGHFIGKNLNTPGVKFDVDSVIKGIRDGVAGKPSPMSDAEYEAALNSIQEKAWSALSETNLKEANDFLQKNAKKSGIVEVVPGKLQYEITQKGTGAAIVEHDKPSINYTGQFINGEVFGSSKDSGGPITIPLDQTIPGFSKGLIGMKEGEKRKLFVHPDLAYGTLGQLPPNSLLIFDIELVKANNPEDVSEDEDEEDEEDLEETEKKTK